jgi:hypothetical protein
MIDASSKTQEAEMRHRYHCPGCSGLLNPGAKVIFVIEGETQRELITLSPEPGDYTVHHSDSLELKPGRIYTFRCPICHIDLTSTVNDRLVEIQSLKDDGTKARVSFSRIHGEHATFFLSVEGVERYGEHAQDFEPVNFFGEGMLTRDR